ncbi:MAG: hypothetical protein K2W99_06340 [Chthoniobacterales bacterium]|nr:hypothetical protein [Chthoniobacterales bacterium]
MKKNLLLALLFFLFSCGLAHSLDLYVGQDGTQSVDNPPLGVYSDIFVGPSTYSSNQISYHNSFGGIPMFYGTMYVGNSSSSTGNQLIMYYNSLITGAFTIGNGSSGNLALSIQENTINSSGPLYVGLSGNENIFFLKGASIWTNQGHAYAGNNISDSNLIIIDERSFLCVDSLTIGYSFSDYNSVNVLNFSSLECTTDSTNLVIGCGGNSNQLLISNGGTVSAFSAIIGESNGDNGNNITLNGSNSSLIINNTNYFPFIVGFNGFSNSFLLTNEANFSCYYGVIGYGSAASNNSVTIPGGSIWTNNQNFYIGFTGDSNNLIITNGGQIIVTGTAQGPSPFGSSYIGLFSSSNSVLVTGVGSLWGNSGNLFVGNFGSYNSLTIEDGGEVVDYNTITYIILTNSSGLVATNYTTNFAGTLGAMPGYMGDSVTLSGSNSLWTNSGEVAIGYAGAKNSLTVNGGTVVDYNGYVGYLATSSNNSVIINGANSLWINSGNLYLGYQGPGNTITITNGGQVVDGNGYVGYGSNSYNNAVFVGPNSIWSNSGNLYIGTTNNTTATTGQGSVTVNNGTVVAQNIYVGKTSSYNSGGSVTLAKNLYLQGGKTGKATLSYVGADVVTVGSTILGNGYIKIDGDTVNFTGTNNYTGTTKILSGTAIASTATAFGTSDVFLGASNKKTAAKLAVDSNIACSISKLTVNNTNATLQLNSGATLAIKRFDIGTNTINLNLNNYRLSNVPKEIITWRTDNRKGHDIFSITNSDGIKKIETNNKVYIESIAP